MATPLLETTDRAFERMYEKYARIVYRYALAVMRNPADAEDITQTTFLNAYRAMKAGEEPLKPRHWLLKIAHNACRMRWVHNSRRPQEVPLEGKVDTLVLHEQERPNVRAVLNELAKLPFNQRSAIVMRELEGRSYEEIAETLDVTVPAVEALLVRARRSMRLRRSAIAGLSAVQLPASLEGLFAGGTAIATGGALAGSVAFKAAAVLVAGLVAGGAGYTAVDAATQSSRAKPARVKVLQPDVGESSSAAPAADAKPQAAAESNRAKAKTGPAAARHTDPVPASASPTIGTAAPPAAVPGEPPTARRSPPFAPPHESPGRGIPSPPAPDRPPATPPVPESPPVAVPQPVLPALPAPPALPALPAVPVPPTPPPPAVPQLPDVTPLPPAPQLP